MASCGRGDPTVRPCPDVDKRLVVRDVMNAVGRCAACFRDEVMYLHNRGLALRMVFSPGVLEVPDEFLLLDDSRSDVNDSFGEDL